MTEPRRFDICVIGGGLVGLATARAILDTRTGIALPLIEKEDEVAKHQSGHSSESFTRACATSRGPSKPGYAWWANRWVYELCENEGIPHKPSGKLVIATEPSSLPRLTSWREEGKPRTSGSRRRGFTEITAFEPESTGIAATGRSPSPTHGGPACARTVLAPESVWTGPWRGRTHP